MGFFFKKMPSNGSRLEPTVLPRCLGGGTTCPRISVANCESRSAGSE
jgi:hypothetical protein